LRNIVIEELKASEVYHQKIEVVERKGLGHPDYICDAIMEQISVNLSQKDTLTLLEPSCTIIQIKECSLQEK